MTVEKWNESWKDYNWISEKIGRHTKVSDTTENKELQFQAFLTVIPIFLMEIKKNFV